MSGPPGEPYIALVAPAEPWGREGHIPEHRSAVLHSAGAVGPTCCSWRIWWGEGEAVLAFLYTGETSSQKE